MVPGSSRGILYDKGVARAKLFCKENGLVMPEMRRYYKEEWLFDHTCAYYRPTYIAICVEKCANPGYGHRAWSWPGYIVDRTPFGVVQHELGHHMDIVLSDLKEGYQGLYSRQLRNETGESPITTYTPNDAEWFAEIFRLFVTNADLLAKFRPKTYAKLAGRFKAVSAQNWEDELKDAPERTVRAARNKICQAQALVKRLSTRSSVAGLRKRRRVDLSE
jgi:hypothetical protein